ncbi:MAG: hypothetical protein UZ08_BCD001002219 [Candidatus Parvibacillus calidus]|jgi:hypothetical protein|nr:MAG: hypothetical protein UZ08_BCD001002219 [Candidatus Parvibacillus calidus]
MELYLYRPIRIAKVRKKAIVQKIRCDDSKKRLLFTLISIKNTIFFETFHEIIEIC